MKKYNLSFDVSNNERGYRKYAYDVTRKEIIKIVREALNTVDSLK